MIRFILPFLVFCLYICHVAEAQQKFECNGSSYISVMNAGKTAFYELTLSDIGIQQKLIADPFEANINAIGYNPKDSLIYGFDTEVNRLFRVWADGTIEGLQFIPLQGDYFAGDIHPDGDKLVLLNSDSLAFISLDEIENPVTYVPISTPDSTGIFTTDIAFHPITKELFGYDGLHGRLISINDNTGEVNNNRYPRINFNDGLPAIFFDPKGDLFGIGNNNSNQESILFKFDLETGLTSTSSIYSPMGDRDGCSCPYTVKLFQKVNNAILAPCTDMEVVITVSNLSNQVLTDYTLREAFPEDYIIREIIHNPFSGNITSGLGESQFEMVGMEIPFGVDSIKLIVAVPETAGGAEHTIQAELIGSAPNSDINSSYLSNDVLSAENNSPSLIQIEEVLDIFDDIIPEVIELCDGDTFRLELPASNDFRYAWSDGVDTLVRFFAVNQEISLDVITACHTETFDISIQETEFAVFLGEDIYTEIGESIILEADISSLSPIDSFIWRTIDGKIPCVHCEAIQVQAKEDIRYLLVAKNESGCITTDEINLFVNQSIYMPNVFSPNGDGINDYFYFVNSFPSVTIKEMHIYDRWGATVFAADNISSNQEASGWDGTVNGKIAAAGTYLWTATITYKGGREEFFKGDVMLQK